MRGKFTHAFPRIARLLAVAVFLSLAGAMVLSYLNQYGFLYRAGEAYPEYHLSRRLVSVTENISHRQLQGDRPLFFLTAARDELYDDGHHELKKVALEVYAENGTTQGWIRAQDCIYDQKRGLVIFKNQVEATTWEDLSLRTERLTYDQNTGVIQTDQPVQFERPRLQGEVIGAEVRTRAGQEQVVLKQDVTVTIDPAASADAPGNSREIRIRSHSGYAIKSDSTLHLLGGVTLTQSTESLTAGRMAALFSPDHNLQTVRAEGKAVMRSQSESRASEVRADSMEFDFDRHQRLQRAVAHGGATAKVVEPEQVRQVRAPRIEAEFAPAGSASVSVTRIIGHQGRVEAQFSSVRPQAAETTRRSLLVRAPSEEKTLTADRVELLYRPEGRVLERALASGSAVLILEPTRLSRDAERKTIRADRMEIEFYDDGHLAKTFTADGHVNVEFKPLEPNSVKPVRVTSSQKLVAQIDSLTQEFSQLTQTGDVRFIEGDRKAKSETAVYSADTHVISMRGDPLVWDSRGRTRADVMDIHMESGESIAQGQVLTTYYNQEATQGAAPFESDQGPVFVAADRAEVKHEGGLAVYIGRARAWQEDQYVRSDRIELYGKEPMMVAVGQVKSGFYHSPRPGSASGESPPVPIFASSGRMTYLGRDRLVRYETSVELQQGVQQLTADRVTVYLRHDTNEIERAVAEGRVEMTEPGRRAFGDQAVYSAVDSRVVLTGVPARVEDDRYEAAQRGPRLTYLLGDDKVMVGDSGGSQRVRSVRKIQ